MKSQKIVALLVAIAMSSAGFAKEVVTRAAPIPVKQSFESQVFDLDGKQNLSAVELTPTEMQETQGEFFPIAIAGIALGAAAIGMWLKHTESKVTTGDWASSKEVAKAGAIDGGIALTTGGTGNVVTKTKTAVTVANAVNTANKTKNTVTATNTAVQTTKSAIQAPKAQSGIQVGSSYGSKTTKQMAEDLSKKYNTNSVSYQTGNTKGHIDLVGKSHFDKKTGLSYETPHVQTLTQNIRLSDGKVFWNNNGAIREATKQDIRNAQKILEQQQTRTRFGWRKR
ncbi:MAG: hypothetical protein IJM09_07310 [Neisseriaceae bacterium]|nr:hypothetical protein [Neisseriaceae bacterium]